MAHLVADSLWTPRHRLGVHLQNTSATWAGVAGGVQEFRGAGVHGLFLYSGEFDSEKPINLRVCVSFNFAMYLCKIGQIGLWKDISLFYQEQISL